MCHCTTSPFLGHESLTHKSSSLSFLKAHICWCSPFFNLAIQSGGERAPVIWTSMQRASTPGRGVNTHCVDVNLTGVFSPSVAAAVVLWWSCTVGLSQPPDAVGTVVSCELTAVAQLLWAGPLIEGRNPPHHTHTHPRRAPSGPVSHLPWPDTVSSLSRGEGEGRGAGAVTGTDTSSQSVSQFSLVTHTDKGITFSKQAWKESSPCPLLTLLLCRLFLSVLSQWEDWRHQWLPQEPFSDGEWPLSLLWHNAVKCIVCVCVWEKWRPSLMSPHARVISE